MILNSKKRLHNDGNDFHMKKPKVALYRDDNTPIRTIEVSNIGDNMSVDYLRGYFEFVAGKEQVTDVTITSRDSVHSEMGRVAYVTFLLPEYAAMMLFNHQKLQFSIKQADTAYQPKLDSTALKLQDLNDHCLLHIASYLLPILIDAVNFSKTSKRLKSISALTFRKYLRHFSYDNDNPCASDEDLPYVLQEVGPYIQNIYWKQIYRHQLECMIKYCVNVKEWKLEQPIIDGSDMFDETSFKDVESLEFDTTILLDDKTMVTIVTSSNLKTLKLKDNNHINGTFFDRWSDCQLEVLEIRNSRAVCNKVLNISNTGRLNSLVELGLDCKELSAEKIDLLQSLKNVRKLTLTGVEDQLAEHVYTSLHKLLPRLVTVKLFMVNRVDRVRLDLEPILDMMISLTDLTHFSHSLMSWKLLHMIRETRERGKQTPIEIGISQQLFEDPEKEEFAAAAKHVIKLTLTLFSPYLIFKDL